MTHNTKNTLQRSITQCTKAPNQECIFFFKQKTAYDIHSQEEPEQATHHKYKPASPTMLQNDRPEAKHHNDQRDLFLASHGQECTDKHPKRTPCIDEVDGKKQER